MPVQLQPYQSMYVDFKSPQISQALNDRYLRNYTAQDKLQESLSQLQAAPFEGDQKLKQQLIEKTQKQLTQLSERGDYENLTIPVMQAARQYTTQAAPIAQNAQAYQSYQKALKEAYDEDKIDYEDYMGTMQLAKQSYTGLQFDAEGNATNFFTGVDPVHNPDVQGKMHDALNGIVAEEFGLGAQIVGMDTSQGTIQVMKEGEVKTVSSERVSSVMDMVMSDPQVTAYLDRKGAIRAASMSEEDLMSLKSTRLNQIQSAVSKAQEALGKADNDEDRSQLESFIGNLLTNAGTIESMQTPDQLRAWAATESAKQMEETYRNAAQSRYGYYSQTVDTQIAPKWMQTIAENGGVGASSIYSGVPGAITSISNPDGTTVEAMTGSIANYANTLSSFEDPDYMQNQFQIPLTGTELLNMSEAEFVQNYPNISTTLFTQAKSAVTTATAMKAATERRLEEVRNTLNINTERELSDIKNSVQGASEAFSTIASTLGVPENQAMDILLAYVDDKNRRVPRVGPGAYMISTPQNNVQPGDSRLDEETLSKLDQLFGAKTGKYSGSAGNIGNRTVNSIAREIKNLQESNIATIDEYLEQTSTTSMSMPVYNTVPFYMSTKEKNDLNQMLSSGNQAIQNNVYLDGNGNSVSFELAVEDMIELQPNSEGFDVESAKLVSHAFAPFNLSGTGGTVQMQYEDENNKKVTVAMPMSAITNPGINRWEASPFARFAAIVGAQRARQVENIVVPAYDAQNNRYEIKIGMRDSGGASYATTVDSQGNELGTYAFEDMLKQDGPLAALIQNGGRIEYR